MADESKSMAIVEGLFEAFRRDGLEAGLADVHPEFEMTTPADLASEPGTYRGHAGVTDWFDSFDEAMDHIQIQPNELRPAGEDLVAASFTLSARGRTSGLEFNQRAAMLLTMRDGKLLRIEYFGDIDAAEAEGRSR